MCRVKDEAYPRTDIELSRLIDELERHLRTHADHRPNTVRLSHAKHPSIRARSTGTPKRGPETE